MIRSDISAATRCHQCDAQACKIAAKRRTLYTYRCHAGLTESITPIVIGNIIIGYLLFGHVFSYASYEEFGQFRERRQAKQAASAEDAGERQKKKRGVSQMRERMR